jgi:hypothetical protein
MTKLSILNLYNPLLYVLGIHPAQRPNDVNIPVHIRLCPDYLWCIAATAALPFDEWQDFNVCIYNIG